MKKAVQLCTAIASTVLLTGCGESLGNRLGAAWVVHNSTTSSVIALGEADALSLAELKEFDSYQSPVLEGLNTATDDYLAGREPDAERTLEYLDPIIDRMLQIAEEE